jgi:hypothetical protein
MPSLKEKKKNQIKKKKKKKTLLPKGWMESRRRWSGQRCCSWLAMGGSG